MMRTTPSRRTILQCSHRTFTDGLTFIVVSLKPVRDPAAGQVIGRELHLDLVPGEDPDEVHAHLAGHVCQHLVAVLELHAEHGVRQRLHHGAFDLDRIFFRHALSGRPREDFRTVPRDRDRVLEMGCEAAVGRHRGPAVLEHPHLPRPHGHHGLDGEHHAGLEQGAPPGLAEVRHLRLLVERPAYPMPYERPHDAETVALALRLHGVGDVADAVPRPALHDGLVEALARDIEELLDSLGDRPDRQGDGAVAVVALDDAAEIEPDDVAVLELSLGRGDAMDDLVIYRGAHRRRVPAIALEGRRGTFADDEGLDVLVDVLGRGAGPHEGLEPLLDLGQDAAGRAHVPELPGGLQQDHRVTACSTALRMAAATVPTAPPPATSAKSLRPR